MPERDPNGKITLREQLEAIEADAARLRRAIAAAPCAEIGHRWRFLGGRHCGCEDGSCSIPVHVCEVCGDCDYGGNEEAAEIAQACSRERDDA